VGSKLNRASPAASRAASAAFPHARSLSIANGVVAPFVLHRQLDAFTQSLDVEFNSCCNAAIARESKKKDRGRERTASQPQLWLAAAGIACPQHDHDQTEFEAQRGADTAVAACYYSAVKSTN